MPGQAFQVAQVGFDFQAQAKPVFTAQVGEEVVNLRVQLKAVGALGHGHQDVQADPLVKQGGDFRRIGRAALSGQLGAQFDQTERAAVKAFAQWVEQRPVFGKGA